MPLTLDDLKQRDMAAHALRIWRQEADEVIRGCRNVVEYRRAPAKWNHVFTDYLRGLRAFTEAQERAAELGMGDGSLAAPMLPLPIWRDDYQWPVLLERLAKPKLLRIAA